MFKLSNIKAENREVVFQRQIIQHDRPGYSNKFQKLLFFLLREGLSQTVRKIRSKKISDELTSQKYLVIIKVRAENKEVYNFSTQYHQDPAGFILANLFYELTDQEIRHASDNWEKYAEHFNQFVGNIQDLIGHPAMRLPIADTFSGDNIRDQRGIVIIGLGDYSRTYIAPNLRGESKVLCVDYNQFLAAYFREKFSFRQAGLTPSDALHSLKNIDTPLLIIASYHSDHTQIAYMAFEINKSTLIFIEKPPCVTLDDLEKLIWLYNHHAKIEIGFNRRKIPYNKKVKEILAGKGPKVINISVKEVEISSNHWYFWNNQGTRVTGNVVHWIDLAQYWIAAKPRGITLLKAANDSETMAIAVQYSDGSLLNITVSDSGNSLRGVQEKIEIRCGHISFFIDDFISMKYINESGRKSVKHMLIRDKGHKKMYCDLMKQYKSNEAGIYPANDLVYTTLVTYYASHMYKNSITHMNISSEIDRFCSLLQNN